MSTILQHVEPLPQVDLQIHAAEKRPDRIKGHNIRQMALIVSVTAWAAIIFALA